MSWFDNLAAASLPLVPRFIVRRLSKRYIAGETYSEALAVGTQMSQSGYSTTYDVLGEAVSDQAGVERAYAEYERLLAGLLEAGLEVYLSVKPTHMGLLIDPELCFDNVSRLAAAVAPHNGFIRFEMEDSTTTTATWEVFRKLHAAHPKHVGCVLQSMLFRSIDDAAMLLELGRPLNVRLVKGVYKEPPEIAHQQMVDVDRAYCELLDRLLAGGAFVGVATHDDKITDYLESKLAQSPELSEFCEVQMLLGVREGLRSQLRAKGLPVRAYIPYGDDWYAYVLRRLRQNPKLARYAFLGLFRGREQLTDDA